MEVPLPLLGQNLEIVHITSAATHWLGSQLQGKLGNVAFNLGMPVFRRKKECTWKGIQKFWPPGDFLCSSPIPTLPPPARASFQESWSLTTLEYYNNDCILADSGFILGPEKPA